MTVWRKLRDLFTFTHNEQKVLIGLALVFLAGAGIKAYRMLVHPSPEADAEPKFDYRGTDSVFRVRSAGTMVPPQEEQQQAPAAGMPKRIDAGKGKIDINTAGLRELLALPGVGESTAARIVAYRARHGAFVREADLTRIKGIGKKKLERLRPAIFIGTDSVNVQGATPAHGATVPPAK